jgi:hypothetical protein
MRLRFGALAALLALAGCSLLPTADVSPQLPQALRESGGDMAIQRVESNVTREEVAEAVAGLVREAPMCLTWPSLWLQGHQNERVFVVRFDLMARDWGAEIAGLGIQRMDEFVELGFLTKRARGDTVEFRLTDEGRRYLRGSPHGDARVSFCAPGQRHMLEIIAMEWGEYPCGSLRVRFTHVADNWPDWARTESTRARFAADFGGLGEARAGTVSLSRQWFAPGKEPDAMTRNGGLRSVCYDSARGRVTGDDLNLNPTFPSP